MNHCWDLNAFGTNDALSAADIQKPESLINHMQGEFLGVGRV